MKRDIPPIIKQVYTTFKPHRQLVRVLWNGTYSANFTITDCLKQTAIISPTLFRVYYDNLLAALCEGVGRFIDTLFLGVLAYAYDVPLLAPTSGAMRQMLQVCDSLAAKFKISFNAIKSKYLVFCSRL